MIPHRVYVSLIRFTFHLFYNPFAFTYDFVSALVSRGRWRAWTRAAIPRIVGRRVLELPCGTGNLLLDLVAAGYQPIGADLSASMLRISQSKLKHGRVPLVRARAQELPFANHSFDSIVMTFPPGFVFDPRAFAEMHRVLDEHGRLLWVDAGRLLPHDAWSRFLNFAFRVVDGGDLGASRFSSLLDRAEFDAKVESVRDGMSVVMVVIATKRGMK